MTRTSDDRQGIRRAKSDEGALNRLAELAGEFGAERLASSARATADRIAAGLFYVACIGQFKRGKSTLLNALVGESVLPTGVIPVTTVPSIVRYGDSLGARVRLENAQWVDISVSDVSEYVSEEKNPENVKEADGVEIFVPSDLLKTGMGLVDTPGLGSVFSENAAATHAFVPQIDAALVVIGADPPLSGDELELVDAVARHVSDLLFVLNKADRASEAERKAAIGFSRDVLAKRLGREIPPVFEVSALERLERRGPSRDWPQLVQALQNLGARSGQALVRQAGSRNIQRISDELIAVIDDERQALLRPLDQSERHLARVQQTLRDAEAALRDLEVLLLAEQQRLSATFAKRRDLFLTQAKPDAHHTLETLFPSAIHLRNGPAYRRELNHMAQALALAKVAPWLEAEGTHAEEEFRLTARRFVELGNGLLHRLKEAGLPGMTDLPDQLSSEQGFRTRSQFQFHFIERVAAPASPFRFMSDLIVGALGRRNGIRRDAHDFLLHLLEVNSSRVQSDVDERVWESKKRLEAEIRETLREAHSVSKHALERARAAHAAGSSAVEAELARLDAAEQEVRSLRDWREVR